MCAVLVGGVGLGVLGLGYGGEEIYGVPFFDTLVKQVRPWKDSL